MDQVPQAAETQQVSETPKPRSLKIPLLIGGVIVILLIGISVLLALMSKESDTPSSAIQPTSTELNTTQSTENAVVMPKLNVTNVTNKSTEPVLPETIDVYTLKQNVSTKDIRSRAEYLGLSRQKLSTQGYVFAYETDALNTKGVATFHKPTGSFQFDSYGILRPSGETKQQIAKSFLEQMHVADETVTCDITYQRKSQPGVTFVECHRSWEEVGLPVFNIVGLLHSAPGQLAQARLGMPDANTPQDADVTAVSLGSTANGKMRQNDFNTATIAINEDNTILFADSNIRSIEKKELFPKNAYITPQEAYQKFVKNETLITIMLPSGSGATDLQKVFQSDSMQATSTTVTDFVLSYLETPAQVSQELFTPMYTFRGEAELTNGYRVKFVASVPALRSGKSFITKTKTLRSMIASVVTRIIPVARAQEDNQEDDSLQLRTFTPPPNPTREQQPTQRPPEPTEPPSGEGFECTSGVGGTAAFPTVTLTIPGIGTMEVLYNKQHTYYLKKTNFPAADMNAVKNAFVHAVEEQYLTNVATHGLPPGVAPKTVFVQMNGGECPIKTPGPLNAPVFNCKGIYSISRLEQVANSVSDKLIAARQNGTLSQLANRPRIFPSGTKNLAGVLLDYSSHNNNSCYISGVSPAVFFYPKEQMQVSVTLPSAVTYVDPPAKERQLHLVVSPDGVVSTSDSAHSKYVYYEYDPKRVLLSIPEVGFSVKSAEVHLAVKEVAKKAGLTNQEAERLMQDVNNELIGNTKPFITLKVATGKELDQVLPVGISPQPDVFERLHIVLTPEDHARSINPPVIDPIERHGYSVVEVGARLN